MPENVPLVAQILVNHSNQSSQRTGGGGQRSTSTSAGGETPDGKKQSKVLQSIRNYAKTQTESAKESAKTGKFSLAKAIGMNFTLGSILKQSQIFASTAGSIFQIMGALVDVILAPFVPLIVPWIRKLAETVPAAAEKARELQQWLVNTAWPYVVGIWRKLPEWLREGVSKPLQYIIGTYLVLKFTGLLNIVTGLLFMGFGTANKTLAAILWVSRMQLKIAKAGAVFAKAAGAGSMGAVLAGISLSLLTLVGAVVAIGVALGFVWFWLKKKNTAGNMGSQTRFLPNDPPFNTYMDAVKDNIANGFYSKIGEAILNFEPGVKWLSGIGSMIASWIGQAIGLIFGNNGDTGQVPNMGMPGMAVPASMTAGGQLSIPLGRQENTDNPRPGPSQMLITVNNNTDDSVTVDGIKRQERPTGGGTHYFDHIRNKWVEFAGSHLTTGTPRLL